MQTLELKCIYRDCGKFSDDFVFTATFQSDDLYINYFAMKNGTEEFWGEDYLRRGSYELLLSDAEKQQVRKALRVLSDRLN